MPSPEPDSLFSGGSSGERTRIADLLRDETIGGVLLLVAAVIALVWANSPWAHSYRELLHVHIGPAELDLNLALEEWAADGLLAIFFFVAGLELKREFVAGDLRRPRRAALPVVAAIGGMLVPAAVYFVVNGLSEDGDLAGWAIPTATDIAFALAVLAVISSHLPSGLRTFLLALAVVDDLLAIIIIAVFFTADLRPVWLLAAMLPLGLFTVLVQRRIRSIWLLLPLALLTWGLVHASGVHSTVAGVLLAFAVPVRPDPRAGEKASGPGLAEHFEHRIRPISAGVAVPVFAFFSAGVSLGGWAGIGGAFRDPVTVGVVAGLVVGKPLGVLGGAAAVSLVLRSKLSKGLRWLDVTGLAMLAGIGFTVSLLIGSLAFGAGTVRDDHAKVAVLVGSVAAALIAAVWLRVRNRHYRDLAEAPDEDQGGRPCGEPPDAPR